MRSRPGPKGCPRPGSGVAGPARVYATVWTGPDADVLPEDGGFFRVAWPRSARASCVGESNSGGPITQRVAAGENAGLSQGLSPRLPG